MHREFPGGSVASTANKYTSIHYLYQWCLIVVMIWKQIAALESMKLEDK